MRRHVPLALAAMFLLLAVPARAAGWEDPVAPVVITYGTLGTVAQTADLERVARKLAFLRGDAQVVGDRGFAPGEGTVYLLGLPHLHRHFAPLRDRLPFVVAEDKVLVLKGMTFEPPWALAAQFPHPDVPGCLVRLFAASDPRHADAIWSTYHGEHDFTLRYRAEEPPLHGDFDDPAPLQPASLVQWESVETAHYIVHRPAGSSVDLGRAAAQLEAGYLRAARYLGAGEDYPGRIRAYLLPDAGLMEAIRGGPVPAAFAAPSFGAEFHLVQGSLGCHETMHLLSRHRWGPPGTFLLNEGVAVAADGWHRNSAHAWARYRRDRGEIPALAELVLPHGWSAIAGAVSYPAAGSFVDYVRRRYGLEAVERLWAAGPGDFEAAVLGATGRTLEELERSWRGSLSWRLPAAIDLFAGKPPVDHVPLFMGIVGLALAAPISAGWWLWRRRGGRRGR